MTWLEGDDITFSALPQGSAASSLRNLEAQLLDAATALNNAAVYLGRGEASPEDQRKIAEVLTRVAEGLTHA